MQSSTHACLFETRRFVPPSLRSASLSLTRRRRNVERTSQGEGTACTEWIAPRTLTRSGIPKGFHSTDRSRGIPRTPGHAPIVLAPVHVKMSTPLM